MMCHLHRAAQKAREILPNRVIKPQEIPSSQSSDWFRKGLLSDQIEQREEFTSSVIAGTILAFSISVSRGARLNLCGFYNICTFMEMVSQVYGRSSVPQNIYGPG